MLLIVVDLDLFVQSKTIIVNDKRLKNDHGKDLVRVHIYPYKSCN